jgi:hypothetical protein
MAYPVLPLHPESKRVVRDGRDETQAVGGATYVRRFYTADRFDFELRHVALTTAQIATLQAFYDANMATTFDFVWPVDGVTYTGMRFGRGGLTVKWISPLYRDVTLRLVAS